MYLFFDTETTGLDNPKLVQLAYILSNEKGTIIEQNDFIVQPYGFQIPDEAVKIHGITNEIAKENGISLELALSKFSKVLEQAQYVVAHNLEFDMNVMLLAFNSIDVYNVFESKKQICTANDLKPLISFPFFWRKKLTRYKLKDLHYQLFKEYFSDAHTATADTMALYKCFWILKTKNLLPCK